MVRSEDITPSVANLSNSRILDRLNFLMHEVRAYNTEITIHMNDAELQLGMAGDEYDFRLISPNELALVIFPERIDDWMLIMQFDGRVSYPEDDDDDEHKVVYRAERMPAHATVADFIRVVISGPCYGYFEGLERVEGLGDDWYVIVWGT